MWFPAFCFVPVSPPRSEDKELELFAEETPNVAPNTAPGCLWLGAMSRIHNGSSHLVSELLSWDISLMGSMKVLICFNMV